MERPGRTGNAIKEGTLRLFCELFGHSFTQPWDAEPSRSSDGVLMVHEWTCWVCRTRVETFEPIDTFVIRSAGWAERSGGSKLPPPAAFGPPRPERYPSRPLRERRPITPTGTL